MSAYRYTLRRDVQDRDPRGYSVLFVMLNPSTADDKVDDPTIRRCVGFARSWGYARLEVGNLYALRATNPIVLFSHEDPVGRENDEQLRQMSWRAETVIVAWGSTPHPVRRRDAEVLSILEATHGVVHCLGVTKHGHPRHPLYVRGDTVPQVFVR